MKEPDLPLTQRILCAIIVSIIVIAVVWISVRVDQR